MKKRFAPLLAFLALLLGLVNQAHAELPTALATAIDTYKADATTAIGTMLVAGAAIWGLRKLGQKLGWW